MNLWAKQLYLPWCLPWQRFHAENCSSSYSTVAVAFFSAMPWSLLSKGVQDLAAATDGGHWHGR